MSRLTKLRKLIWCCLFHYESITGKGCVDEDCEFRFKVSGDEWKQAYDLGRREREILVTRDKLYETVKCPACGTDYEAIPRYALVAEGKIPLLWSNGHVITGSKEEIELLINSHREVGSNYELDALELDAAQWIIVFKRDAEPITVNLTKDREEAFKQYDALATCWSEVYLCQVIKGLPIEP